ncbi:MAG: ABC transporter substrate-binding protein [Chloroflexi bacterium]|nr:ABC transporter substrate-binding protein [Chloroflexota bacterium]
MKRRDVLALLAIGGLLLACRSAPAPAASPAREQLEPATAASAPPPAARAVRVAYVALSPAQSPPWIAVERGLFEKHGLAVELTRVAGGEAIKALVAGELDFAFGPAGTAALARLQGGDVAVIGSMIHTLPYEVWVGPAVAQPADLRGKRLGINRLGTTTDFVARFALRRWGLEPDRDVPLIQVGETGEMLAAMERGAIDAAVMESLYGYLAAKQGGLHRLVNVSDLGLVYLFGGIETRRSLADSEPDLMLRFLKATVEAIALFKQEREFTLDILAKYTRLDDREALAYSWEEHATRYFQRLPYPTREGYTLLVEEQAAVEPAIRQLDPADLLLDRFVRELDTSGFVDALYR